MYRVVLTGGIASGKSAASAMFQELGVTVVDADQVSRELVQPGQPALQRIAQRFGRDILNQDGSLNRKLLRERVFSKPDARQALEDILHPLIHRRVQALADAATSPYVVMVIPLLLEARQKYDFERVLLIDTPEEIQRSRLMQRDGSSNSQVDQLLAAQSTRAQRLAVADDVIVNNGGLEQLRSAVEKQHLRFLSLSNDA